MIPLSSAVSSGISWSVLPQNRDHEVKLHGRSVGILTRASMWSNRFDAATSYGNWSFLRSGFFGTGTQIVDSASQQAVATFHSAWNGGGKLTFVDGQEFHLECKGLWQPTWNVTTRSGQRVFSLHTREKTVDTFAETPLDETRRLLLVFFILYRIRQAEEDAASAAMIAS